MPDSSITCPHCHRPFELTTAMSASIEAKLRSEIDAQAARQKAQLDDRERSLAEKAAVLQRDRAGIDEQIAARLTAERTRIADEIGRKARQDAASEIAVQMTAIQDELARSKTKLAQTQQAELDLRRQKQELEEAQREFELQKQRAIDAERGKIQEKAQRDAAEEFRLKAMEKDKILADTQRQLAEATRKLEQGSQQLQGETQELHLESVLRATFPRDTIEPVPKGQFGGDVLQRVAGPLGHTAGTILWESKRTQSWSDKWLEKLRSDQREAKAEVCAILTSVMPKGIETFGVLEEVWVCSRACVIPVATALRYALVEVSLARAASEGRQTKQELLYSYLTGPGFRHRIAAIMEAFQGMQQELEAEKRVIQKQWAKRQRQIESVILNTAAMYGELQGIAGKSMPEIQSLELKALEGGDASVDAN
ncbi:MAG: DUF2130 domain-containing protein [Phycisphaerales bacterium]|nr:DUF2130 domain-containing protein [Phycisphaerales bacterium]